MADEVSTGELARRIDEVKGILQGLVSRPEYSSDQRHVEHRFTEIERDIEVEKAAREAADKALHERMDKSGTNWRQTVFSGLVPGVFFLLTMAVTILLAFRGGR
ncbi:hypothetical protein [Streptomyces sp.]|uniref:hypothetical protein n=1 Tax=Streptomyces sp. TaxID=1931 RepID=UPI002F94FB10